MPLFYILYSPTRKRYYVGHTTEPIEERVRKHNSNHSGFTGKTGDWRVVYLEEYPSKSLAYQREREVKSWKSRKRIEELVGR
jgi:putative endonuclease